MYVRNPYPRCDEVIGPGDIRIAMPRVIPIIHPNHAGSSLRWLNERWLEFHYFNCRIWGPLIAWCLFLAKRAEKYPKIALIVVGVVLNVMEKNGYEHPILTNTYRYALHESFPGVAKLSFAEPQVERDPIGRAAARTVEDAVAAFVESADFRRLKEDVGERAALQATRDVYQRAGLDEAVARVDAQLAELPTAR